MNTINKINAYLRERGLLNEEETKKQENSPTEIQVRRRGIELSLTLILVIYSLALFYFILACLPL